MLVLAPVPAYKVPSHFLVGSCNWMQHITRMMKNQQVQLSLDRSHSILTVQCAVAPTGPIKQEPSSVQSRVQLYFSWSRKNLKINCSGLIVTYTFSIFFFRRKGWELPVSMRTSPSIIGLNMHDASLCLMKLKMTKVLLEKDVNGWILDNSCQPYPSCLFLYSHLRSLFSSEVFAMGTGQRDFQTLTRPELVQCLKMELPWICGDRDAVLNLLD